MNYQITADNLTVITHNDLPVITTELLAQLYRTEVKHIQNNYLRNADRFIVGKHLFKLENYELKNFKNRPSLRGLVAKNTRSLILWTERGRQDMLKCLKPIKHGMYSSN